MANILEDDKYYEGIDREKGVWVEVDPNEKRNTSFEYIDLVNMSGFGGSPTRSTYYLVNRQEYERIQKICDEIHNECMEVVKNEKGWKDAFYKVRYDEKNYTQEHEQILDNVSNGMFDILADKLDSLDIDDIRLVAKEMDARETKALKESDNYVETIKELSQMRSRIERLKYELQVRAWAVNAKRSDFERTEINYLHGSRRRTIKETRRWIDEGRYRQALTTQSEYRHFEMEMEHLQSRIKSKEEFLQEDNFFDSGIYIRANVHIEELIKQNTQITQLIEDFNRGKIEEFTPEQLEIPQIALTVINSKRTFARKMATELPRSVLKNPQVAMALMGNGYAKYTDLPREAQSNREVVQLAIQRDGYELKNVPEQFRGDVEIIKMALDSSKSIQVLKYITDEVKTDRKVAEQLVQVSGASLEYLAPEMQNDRDLAKLAISNTKYGLKFVSPELRNDEEIVKLAMETNIGNIEFISDRLKADADIVGKAVNQDFNLVKHISPDLREDEKLADAFAKYDLMEDYKWDRVTLKDVVDSKYFADEQFRKQIIEDTRQSLQIPENIEIHSAGNPNYLEETVSAYPEILNIVNLGYENKKLVKMAIKYNYKNVERVWRDTSNNDEFKAEYKSELEMCDTIEKYKTDEMKLKDIKSDYFTNPMFYNDIVGAMKDKMQAKFMEVTQGLNPDEELNEELQAKFEKQLSKVQSELERRKKFAMLKAGIKDKVDKLLHRDEASKIIKQVSSVGV